MRGLGQSCGELVCDKCGTVEHEGGSTRVCYACHAKLAYGAWGDGAGIRPRLVLIAGCSLCLPARASASGASTGTSPRAFLAPEPVSASAKPLEPTAQRLSLMRAAPCTAGWVQLGLRDHGIRMSKLALFSAQDLQSPEQLDP